MAKKNIDFVLCWVDGSDQQWLEKQQAYHHKNNTDATPARYRDWDLLRFWFRGIEEFAPWVNKIYFITDHQKPKWLNEKHEKIVLINHEDYIDKDYLPTFNSNAIELDIYKIKGLSEQFVIFNDDMFIINKVQKEDFFKNNLPCDTAVIAPSTPNKPHDFAATTLNNLAVINENFKKNDQIQTSFTKWFNIKYRSGNIKNLISLPWNNFIGFREPHIPESLLKTTCEVVAGKYPELIKQTKTCKFRDYNNNISHWVYRDWQVASNNFYPRSINFGHSYALPHDLHKIKKTIIKQKNKTICINDSEEINNAMFSKIKKELIDSFTKILPKKSSFERK